MNASKWAVAGLAGSLAAAGCASIIDFDAPFEGAGGASTTSGASSTSAHGGRGGASSSTTSASGSSTTSSACVPKSSCAEVGFTCGTFFNGCEDEACGACALPFTCADSSHTCACPNPVTVHPTLVADTAIQHHSAWVCGSLTAGAFPCINVSQSLDDSRALLRFSIDAATQKALTTPGAVISANLTLRPAAVCDGSSFTNTGKAQVHVLRNDWDEGGARWCHRSGPQDMPNVNPWGMQGAEDPTVDRGPLAAEVDMSGDNMPFDISLDPSKLVSPLVTGTQVSLLVLTPVGSKLVIETKEGGAPATLDIEYCPVP